MYSLQLCNESTKKLFVASLQRMNQCYGKKLLCLKIMGEIESVQAV